MSVPQVAHGQNEFWERIDGAPQVFRKISGRSVTFFVQPTLKGSCHACTVDDIAKLLSHVPVEDWEGIDAVLLRQPRRKESILSPAWGRLAYAADFVGKAGRVVYRGPAVVIEAVDFKRPLSFGRGLDPDCLAELERLKFDGHTFRAGDTRNIIEPTLEACRATQLYRALLHELGHWVDFLEKVERPAAQSGENIDYYSLLLERFHARPTAEKEKFAHRYAERLHANLSAAKAIPFARVLDAEQLTRDKLSIEDFLAF